MPLTIDLFCNDGSPIGVIPSDIYGRGVGGAELALMSWAETMAAQGHRIRIYNDPVTVGNHGGVEYHQRQSFTPRENRDVFVIFRSPNKHIKSTKAGIKLHWSTDQFTVGNFARDIVPFVDRVVCISPYHTVYYKDSYGVPDGKIGHIDLGVRLADYTEPIERVPGRCIFCSIAERGLEVLYGIWPKIRHLRPDASLVITGDYRLWGSKSPGNHHHRMAWLHVPGILFLGAIPRTKMVEQQMMAQVHSYSCTYEELFCISAAACQVAGAAPVTRDTGALRTTNEIGAELTGNATDPEWQRRFAQLVVKMMELPDSERAKMQERARARFDWNRICGQWEQLIETGEFPQEKEMA